MPVNVRNRCTHHVVAGIGEGKFPASEARIKVVPTLGINIAHRVAIQVVKFRTDDAAVRIGAAGVAQQVKP